MNKHTVLIGVAFAFATFVGWMDSESTSLTNVFQLQNFPAMIIYTFAFYFVLVIVTSFSAFAMRLIIGLFEKTTPGY